MGKRKRWGKRYNDTRDWTLYNEQLVKRGEFYFSPRFLQTWLPELKVMNAGKEGNPYLYPKSLIAFLAIVHAKSFDYRACQGMLRVLSRQFHDFPVISFSQICRRINALDVQFDADGNDMVVGVDGSGIKVTNRGEWMRKIWSNTPVKGWIKVTILGNTKGDIVDVKIGNEGLDERKAARTLVRKHRKKAKKLLADGLHDDKQTFNLCKQLQIEPVIKIRSNASEKADGSFLRKQCVKEYKELGYKRWAKEKQYGLRWVCTEGIFSAVKRIFGECVHAVKKRFMYQEARLKFWAYQQLLHLA